MSKFLGKLIGSDRKLPNVNNASGIWNTSEQIQSQKVNNWPITSFINLALPEITGTSTIGYKALGCTTGLWSITRNVVYQYQWIRDGIDISGATNSVYTLVPSDGGAIISCRVTATYTLTNLTVSVVTAGTTAIVIPVVNQAEYTIPGTYTWICPEEVYYVSVICVGAGGPGEYESALNTIAAGGGGGGTGWKNNITVVPGQSYTVVVGAGGNFSPPISPAINSEDSYFISNLTVLGGKGSSGSMGSTGGTYIGDGGGIGGTGGTPATINNIGGGGGAGGYTGPGGAGGATYSSTNGSGGGGGGGGGNFYDTGIENGGNGGGVGIYGIGIDGILGTYRGTYPDHIQGYPGSTATVTSTAYGAGGAGVYYRYSQFGYAPYLGTYRSSSGAVRIIWPGNLRQFPGTRTANERDILVTTLNVSNVVVTQGTSVSVTPVIASRGVSPYTYSITPILPSGLIFNTNTGGITGTTVVLTPLTSYTVTVVDSITLGFTAQTSYKIFTLSCSTALDGVYSTLVATTDIPTTTVKQEDTISFKPVSATGGLTPYIYTVNTVLPSGVTLNSSTGIISGNTKDITIGAVYYVTVTDASLRASTSSFILTVAPVADLVALSNIGIPPVLNHNIGTALDIIPIYGFDGLAPYSYSISPALPYGLTFSTVTGKITGNASVAAASKQYTIIVIDSLSETVSATISLTITLQPLIATTTISTSTLIMNTSASFKPVYASTSGGAPLNYSINPTLPAGLSISSTSGIISGTPTTYSGLTTYTITILDITNQTGSNTFTMKVNYPLLTSIANTAAVNGAMGTNLSVIPVSGSGGVLPYSYSINPAIPIELSFSSSTGTISGTPMNGFPITTMTIIVTDAVGQTSSNDFSLFIEFTAIPSQIAFTWPGTYNWTVPEGVTSISVLMVTPGGSPQASTLTSQTYAGSGGGGLGYVNNMAVTPGQVINVVIPSITNTYAATTKSSNTTFTLGSKTITGISGSSGSGSFIGGAGGYVTFAQLVGISNTGGLGGVRIGTAGGNSTAGGGGAAGYSGSGGAGGDSSTSTANAGTAGAGGGGGGGGGQYGGTVYYGGAGGGIGLFGQGTSGTGGAADIYYPGGGTGGSGGKRGEYYGAGFFGGGGTGYSSSSNITSSGTTLPNLDPIVFFGTTGGGSAVRIIWPGSSRQYPSTGTADTSYTAPYNWSTSSTNPIISFPNAKSNGTYLLAVPANSISDITGQFVVSASTGIAPYTDVGAGTYKSVPNGVLFNGIKYLGYIYVFVGNVYINTYTFKVNWLSINSNPITLTQANTNGIVYYGAKVYVN